MLLNASKSLTLKNEAARKRSSHDIVDLTFDSLKNLSINVVSVKNLSIMYMFFEGSLATVPFLLRLVFLVYK